MAEDKISAGATGETEAPDAGSVEEDELLDEEASALLKELEDSQLEVQRMIQAQREQASELSGMKDHLANDLQQLQDDAWKLQVFAELEMLKRQLAALNSLDADLDAMEAKLDEGGDEPLDDAFEKELEAARAGTRDLLSKVLTSNGTSRVANGAVAGADEAPTSTGAPDDGTAAAAEGEEVEDVEALQDELDAELAAMHKQLQAIKAESALVAARKAQLELELMQLIQDGADDLTAQLQGLDVEEAEGKVSTGANTAPA